MIVKELIIKADDIPILEDADIELDFSNNNNLEDTLSPYMFHAKSVEIGDRYCLMENSKNPVEIGQKVDDMIVIDILYEKKPWWKLWKKKKQIGYIAEMR